MKKLEMVRELPKCHTETRSGQMLLEKCHRLICMTQTGLPQTFQSVKSAVSAEHDRQDVLVLQHVAARRQPRCGRDRELCPAPSLFWAGVAGLPRRARLASWSQFREPGLALAQVLLAASLTGVQGSHAFLLSSLGPGKGVEGCSCFSTAAFCKALEITKGYEFRSLCWSVGSECALWPWRCSYQHVLSGWEGGVAVPLLLQPSLTLCPHSHPTPASA